MDRRDFLKKLGIGAGAVATATVSAVAGEKEVEIVEKERVVEKIVEKAPTKWAIFDRYIKNLSRCIQALKTSKTGSFHLVMYRTSGDLRIEIPSDDADDRFHYISVENVPDELQEFIKMLSNRNVRLKHKKLKDQFLTRLRSGSINGAKDVKELLHDYNKKK